MKNIINNYSSIEQLTNQYLNKQKSTEKKINGISFEEILKQQTQPVKFSKHASMRLTQRNINLSDDQSMRLQKGIAAADSKGVNDSIGFRRSILYDKCNYYGIYVPCNRTNCNGIIRLRTSIYKNSSNIFKCIYKY